MTNIAHKNLSGVDLHEPKGIASATNGQVYVANGSSSGAWATPPSSALVEIKTIDISASPTQFVNFVNGVSGVVLDSTYDAYQMRLSNLKCASNDAAVYVRVGTGAGPTYQSTAVYYWAMNFCHITGGSTLSSGGATVTQMQLTFANGSGNAMFNGALDHFSSTIDFDKPGSTDRFNIRHQSYWWGNTNGPFTSQGMGVYVGGAAVTAVQILNSSSAFTSGRVTLYGMTKI